MPRKLIQVKAFPLKERVLGEVRTLHTSHTCKYLCVCRPSNILYPLLLQAEVLRSFHDKKYICKNKGIARLVPFSIEMKLWRRRCCEASRGMVTAGTVVKLYSGRPCA